MEFARRFLDFGADSKQAEILLSTSKRGILNCSRQWGKSTVAAVKAVHRAYTQPDSAGAGGGAGGAAERGVVDEGPRRLRRAGRAAARGWEQRDIARVSERVADCGAAGE